MYALIACILALWTSTAWAVTQTIVASAAGPTQPILLNLDYFLPGVGIVCSLSDLAALTYQVEVSGDPLPISNIVHWNKHDVLFNKTVSANDSIAFPVTAARVNITTYSSGTVTCQFVQANATVNVAPYQKGTEHP